MKNTLLFLWLTLISVHYTYAQSAKFDWVKTWKAAEGKSIAMDSKGNVYTAGYFYDTTDLDPGAGVLQYECKGLSDIYINKFDDKGRFIWGKAIGGKLTDIAYSIAVDASDNVYIAGSFFDTVDFDPGIAGDIHASEGFSDAFIIKLNSLGDFVWTKQIGGEGAECIQSIALDASGNIYATGFFGGIVDFDPGPGTLYLSPVGGSDIFITKLDPSGNLFWAESFGSSSEYDIAYDVTVDDSNNVIVTGTFGGTTDFDPGPGVYNLYASTVSDLSMFLVKLSTTGSLQWAKNINSNGVSGVIPYATTVDQLGHIYTTGFFTGMADFDPDGGVVNLSGYPSTIFICKMNRNGNLVWAKHMRSDGVDSHLSSGNAIAVDKDRSVYMTGFFSGTVDFDPGSPDYYVKSRYNYWDAYISKLDSDGNFLWVKTMGEDDRDIGNGVLVNSKNEIYTTGGFRGAVDFDPDSGIYLDTPAKAAGAYLHKMVQMGLGIAKPIEQDAIQIYPNPTQDAFSLTVTEPYLGAEVQIVNVFGQIIRQFRIRQLTTKQCLLPGLYFVEIRSENTVRVEKLQVN